MENSVFPVNYPVTLIFSQISVKTVNLNILSIQDITNAFIRILRK